jgi:hypothetical protein
MVDCGDATLVFVGLAVGCGYPLAAGITHMANRMPGYVASAERGNGWLGHLLRDTAKSYSCSLKQL